MALDPTIALGVKPAPIQSPLEALSTIAQLQGVREQTEVRRLAGEKARQQAADEAAIRRVLTETGGDVEKALPQLRMIAPKAALEFETEIGKARTEKLQGLKADLEFRSKKLDLGLKVAQSMTDEAGYRVGRPMLLGLSPELESLLPETYDPAAMTRLTNMGLSAKELSDQRQEGLKLYTEGKAAEALSTFFSTARTPEEWDTIAEGAVTLGTPRELVAQFGSFSPENVARAAQLGITPEKRATLAGQAETRAQTAAHQTATEANAAAQLRISGGNLAVSQARERREAGTPDLVQVMKDGQAVWVPKVQAAGQPAAGGATGRPATEGERKAAGFYGQMQQALTNINQLESQLTSRDLYQIQSLPQEGFMGAINRGQMSDAAKRYIQAFNQFTEARLRPVSGAAIADSEYARDRATYGKQYAETKDLATQRQAARAQALGSLRTMAGSALEGAAPSADPLTVTTPDGKIIKFDTAAEVAAFKRRTGLP